MPILQHPINVRPVVIDRDVQPLAEARVLMVDPHDASRSVLRDCISRLGCRSFTSVSSYSDAIRALRSPEAAIDMVFCEYNLPAPRDGQQLLEELRIDRVIPPQTSFFMITGETSYSRVVSAAEFAPDDYLIKPFSVTQLQQRIVRLHLRKQLLRPAFELMQSGHHAAAADRALAIGRVYQSVRSQAGRLAVECLMAASCHEEAERLIRQLIADQPDQAAPWTVLTLSQIVANRGNLAEAIELLKAVLLNYPDFLRGYDTLADLLIRHGRRAEAMSLLKQATDKSSSNVARLRSFGRLAEDLGDLPAAEVAYVGALDRVKNTALLTGEDFANAYRVLVAQEKHDAIAQVASDQRRLFRRHPDHELTSAMLTFFRVRATAARSDQDRAPLLAAATRLADIVNGDTKHAISPGLLVQVVAACLHEGLVDIAFSLAVRLSRRPHLDPGVITSVQALLDTHRRMLERTKPSVLRIDPSLSTAAPTNASADPPRMAAG